MKSEVDVKSKGLGIRGLFRVSIFIVVAGAFLVLASISFANITDAERNKADASIHSEVNYLCLQLESLGNRAGVFSRLVDEAGVDPQELKADNLKGYQLLSDPICDVLSGYTLAETGTGVLIEDGVIISSDDARVLVGSDARGLLGDEVCDGIAKSIEADQMQLIPYRGVFDEDGGEGSYGNDDDEAYVLARQQGDVTVAIIEPMSMVFRDRDSTMARETIVGLVVLIVVFLIVDRLLSLLVARRIDRTNKVLERITSGDLEARVEDTGTREFKSLASGINITVEALQGWIAEAETRMDSELAAARAIQESVLPRTFPPYPDIDRFDIYALMNAAREVGGDFYDFFLISDKPDLDFEPSSGSNASKLAFLIADVSGKGVPAALFMMKAKAQVRRELQSGLDVSRAIDNANRELVEGNDACMFVTMWVGVLDYETGHIDYVNAGHNPPLLWQEGAGWTWMENKSGLPLGLIDVGSYDAYPLDCRPGDKILLYTDGVTEAMNVEDELFGDDRLEAVVNARIGEHPEELVMSVRQDVASFAQDAEQSDDITILALELNAPSS